MFRIESDGPHSGTCELEDRTKYKQKLKLIKDVVKENKDRKKNYWIGQRKTIRSWFLRGRKTWS